MILPSCYLRISVFMAFLAPKSFLMAKSTQNYNSHLENLMSQLLSTLFPESLQNLFFLLASQLCVTILPISSLQKSQISQRDTYIPALLSPSSFPSFAVVVLSAKRDNSMPALQQSSDDCVTSDKQILLAKPETLVELDLSVVTVYVQFAAPGSNILCLSQQSPCKKCSA